MKQLPITTAEVWAVPVPANATNISKTYSNGIVFEYNDFLDSISFNQFYDVNSDWQILGTSTKYIIDFDASVLGMTHRELRSAIEAAGYLFTNPYGGINPLRLIGGAYHSKERKSIRRDALKWQAAQHNVIEKLVIIRKV